MTASLIKLMQRRFVEAQDEYVGLVDEDEGTLREFSLVSERSVLLSKFIKLEGRNVSMPEEMTWRRPRRTA